RGRRILGRVAGGDPGRGEGGEFVRALKGEAPPAEKCPSRGHPPRPRDGREGPPGARGRAGQRAPAGGEGDPDTSDAGARAGGGGERAGEGRQQAGEQEATRDDRKHRGGHGVRRPAVQRGHRPTDERGSADEPQDGETHAWPAASERREEPAHNTPTPAYGS